MKETMFVALCHCGYKSSLLGILAGRKPSRAPFWYDSSLFRLMFTRTKTVFIDASFFSTYKGQALVETEVWTHGYKAQA
jgi:hypothetical protein